MSVGPEKLMAYADGELDDVTAKRVERAMAADPLLAEQVRQHQELAARIAATYARVAAAPVPWGLRSMLRGAAAASPRQREWKRPRPWMLGAAIAASLVAGMAIGRCL